MAEAATDEDADNREPHEYELLGVDQNLRAFILKHYTSLGAHEIDGKILVENMEHLFKRVRNGTVPRKRTLTEVKST